MKNRVDVFSGFAGLFHGNVSVQGIRRAATRPLQTQPASHRNWLRPLRRIRAIPLKAVRKVFDFI